MTVERGATECGCIADVNAKMAEHNAEVMMTWYPVARPMIETVKRDPKKRGKPPLLVASFCPFCGVKYPAFKEPPR